MLLNASGCLDALTAPDVARSLDAFVTKTVTPLPRGGNAPVRIAETDHGMLNSIGLANAGMDAFVGGQLPRLAELGVPIWVSVGGFDAEDYAGSCEVLDERPEVAAVELNLSCPNVEEAPESAAEIVAQCRPRSSKPLFAKLSPAVPDIAAVAVAVMEAGADGLSLVNTIRGLALDERTLEPRLATATGGYSGPALKPVALAAVYACYRATRLPIVGMGGVSSGRDALELVAAGATHVALGTVLFSDPHAPTRMRAELEAEAAALGFAGPTAVHAVSHGASVVSAGDEGRARVVSVEKMPGYRRKICRLTGRVRVLVSRAMVSPKLHAQAPLRSLDQRMEALKRANEIRVRRAQLKKDLKDGRAQIEEILKDPPDYVSTAKVFDMLMAVPKFGRVKAARFLNMCRISQSKTVGGLSERQRAELIGLFSR